MKKISILSIVGIAILFLGCARNEDIWSDVGRYQVIHYTAVTNPQTDFFLRVDTQNGWTEVFYQDGNEIKYMDSFFSPEIEGKKALKKN